MKWSRQGLYKNLLSHMPRITTIPFQLSLFKIPAVAFLTLVAFALDGVVGSPFAVIAELLKPIAAVVSSPYRSGSALT